MFFSRGSFLPWALNGWKFLPFSCEVEEIGVSFPGLKRGVGVGIIKNLACWWKVLSDVKLRVCWRSVMTLSLSGTAVLCPWWPGGRREWGMPCRGAQSDAGACLCGVWGASPAPSSLSVRMLDVIFASILTELRA